MSVEQLCNGPSMPSQALVNMQSHASLVHLHGQGNTECKRHSDATVV
jgi:hypothetical protein